MARLTALLVFATFAACGGGGALDAGAPGSADGGAVDAGGLDAGSADAGGLDAGLDAGPADAGGVDAGSCTGACATTTLGLLFGTVQGPLDRAQHGLEPDGGLYVEAHAGGDPACPTMTSPTPQRTVVIAGLRVGAGVQTLAEGLRVTLLDFQGTLTSRPLERAVSARATPRFVRPGELISYTLEATFDGGTLTGGFAAAHCPSLDSP